MTKTGRSRIFDQGIRVYGPRELNKNGEWSKSDEVVALFKRPIDAVRYLRQRVKEGYPAYVSNADRERVEAAEREAAGVV